MRHNGRARRSRAPALLLLAAFWLLPQGGTGHALPLAMHRPEATVAAHAHAPADALGPWHSLRRISFLDNFPRRRIRPGVGPRRFPRRLRPPRRPPPSPRRADPRRIPPSTALRLAMKRVPGSMGLGVELLPGPRPVYAVKLKAGSRILRVLVDAVTGRVVPR